MRPRDLRWLMPLALVASGRAPSPALASPQSPARLVYQAPPECPGEAAFRARVQASGAELSSGEAAPHYGITLQSQGDRFVGRLEVRDPVSGTTVREVMGDTCAAAAEALAFIVALAHEASGTGSAPVETARTRAPEASGRIEVTIGAGAALQGAIAPGVVPGGRLSVEVLGWSSFVSPSVRVVGLYSATTTTSGEVGSASFRLLSGKLEGCAGVGRTLRVGVCGGYEGGSLKATGGGVSDPREEARPWHAIQVAGRAQWRPGERWFVEVEAGAVVPLTARRFVFESPRAEVFTVPRVAGAAAAGVGVRFP